MAQFLRPASDISGDGWLPSEGSDLFATIDESVASDSDYNYTESEIAPGSPSVASAFEVALSAGTDPASSADHTVRYRAAGNGVLNLVVTLKQGATPIASWTEEAASASFTDYAHTLTTGEADAITDYGDLSLHFEAVAAAGGGSLGFARRGGDADHVEEATPIALTWPAGVTSSDLAVIAVCWFEDVDHTVTTPTDFTERTAAGGQVISGTGGAETRVSVFSKELVGTESGNVNVGFSGNVFASATLTVFQGSGDLTFASLSAADTGTGTDATAPSVTGTAGQGLVAIYGLTDPPGTTNSGPSGMTLGDDDSATTNATRIYYQDLVSSGATGTKTWDFTNSRSWGGFSMLITITP